MVQLAALGAIMSISPFCVSLTLLLASFSESIEPLSCGQASCYLLLTRLGVPITIVDLDQEFSQSKSESSFRELQLVLENHGVAATPWKLDWEQFRSIRGPFIAHIDDLKTHFRHYHVAEWKGSELVILDPLATNPIHIAADSGFAAYRNAFSGHVLVPASEVPHLWQWQSQLRIGSILLAIVGIPAFGVLRHKRSKALRAGT